MRELVVLEHTAAAGLSAFTQVLDSRTTIAPWRRVDVPAGAPLPTDVGALAGLVVMGGTMSATDPDAHAWMPAELDLLRRVVAADVPVLGICLGAQLLGAALGGEIAARPTPEVGYIALHRTEAGADDAVFGGWPDGAASLAMHEDEVVTLPADAVPMLSGGDGVPAWRIGQAWAVQVHPEVTEQQLASWVSQGMVDGLVARSGVDVDALLAEAARRSRFTVAQGRALVGRFLDGPVRRHLQDGGG